MSDIEKWGDSASSNQVPSPDGFPEGMPRSGVNDSAREMMGAMKRWYDLPHWRNPLDGFDYARVNGTTFTFADAGGKVNAKQYLGLNGHQVVRISTSQGVWYGWVVVSFYTAGVTTVGVEWNLSLSPDGEGPTQAGVFEVGWDSGNVVLRSTGASPENVPLMKDLDAHVLKPEVDLDVGFLGGQTADQIGAAARSGRINHNGAFSVWQRGEVFPSVDGEFPSQDGALTADLWPALSASPGLARYRRSSDAPAGFSDSMEMESVSSDGRWGIAYVSEPADTEGVFLAGANRRVSASFWARWDPLNSGISTIRVTLLNQTSTPLGPLVLAWPTPGLDFTPGTGWEIIASQSIALTSAWQLFKPFENVDPNVSGVGNGGFAIAFTVDQGGVPGAKWLLAAVQVNEGASAVDFVRAPIQQELARCLRYCETTFAPGVQPAHAQGDAEALIGVSSGVETVVDWRFSVPKLAAPTVRTFNPRLASPPADEHFDSGSAAIAVSSKVASVRGAQLVSLASVDSTIYRIGAYCFSNTWGTN